MKAILTKGRHAKIILRDVIEIVQIKKTTDIEFDVWIMFSDGEKSGYTKIRKMEIYGDEYEEEDR